MITGLVIILILYAAVFIVAEALYRRGYTARTTRKIVHIGSGIVSFFLPILVNLKISISIGIFFVFLLFWTKKKQLLGSVHRIENQNFGAIFFPIGLILCALMFWNINSVIFQGSALIVGLSDGLAGIFGHRFGKKGYNFTGYKTLEGSFLFFLITFVILALTIFFYQNSIGLPGVFLAVLGALALSLVEGLFGKGLDNLFVTLFSGLIIYLIL